MALWGTAKNERQKKGASIHQFLPPPGQVDAEQKSKPSRFDTGHTNVKCCLMYQQKSSLRAGIFVCFYHTVAFPAPKESESEVAQLCQLFATPWTVAYQAPPSIEFSKQEYWSGLPLPSPESLPNSGIKPRSPAFAGRRFTSKASS